MIPAELLLEGYRRGVFPMADQKGEILWFSPDPRGIIPLDGFHAPHSVKSLVRQGAFEIRLDYAFESVMRGCAAREETWISEAIIESYCELHLRGFAHSVEAWNESGLVGGLYGIGLGGVFFGESMFHTESGASKVALYALVDHLRTRDFVLLDIQWLTPHLSQFGAVEISREEYHRRLITGLMLERSFCRP